MPMPADWGEERLGELLLGWHELREQGRDVTAAELCTDCPELIEELARRIEAVRKLDLVLDTDDTEDPSNSGAGGPNGPGASRKLPDALRASAVYRPERHHAQGGLGQIIVAREDVLDRPVALKRIRPDRRKDGAGPRFLREATITARLQHPGIVPIYGLGQDEDGPFYTMPFIQGQTLQEAIRGFQGDDSLQGDPGRRSLRFRGLLQQFVTVCNTVAYAHDQGIVHRDLKPSNIMLGPYGETLVMDWGLAKPFAGERSVGEDGADVPSTSSSPEELTDIGAILGTPEYMSPEQAKGQPTGPASDIFSLGLILYAILTGKSAFDMASLEGADRLKAVREAAVVPPRHRDPSVPRGLEAVCFKALSARPEDRYASARALADEVTKWLADEPVTAWREPWLVRARRWAKRHRTAAAAAAAGCAAALLAGGIWLYSNQNQVRQETGRAEAALARAEQSRSDAQAAWERLDATAWVRAEDMALAAANLDSRRVPVDVHRRLRDLSATVMAEAAEVRADEALLKDLAAVRAARNDPHYDAPSEYGRAFRKRGLDVAAGDPVAAAATLWNRPRLVAVEIASYLDDWSLVLRIEATPRDQAERITALARALDPDPWRNRLRDAVSLSDRAAQRLEMLRLAAESDVAAQPSQTVTLLAAALREAGEPGEAIALLEPARFRHPDVPWIFQELGLSLSAVRPQRREDALRAFTAVTTLKPEIGFELARSLSDSGRAVEAISVVEAVVLRRPEAMYLYELGFMKGEVGLSADAKEVYQRAIAAGRSRVKNGSAKFDTHMQLGLSLYRLGDLGTAVSELREATRLKPESASAHNNLGFALHDAGKPAGAIAEFREAIRLKPDFAEARMNLGSALYRGDPAGGIAELREAIRLKPDLARAHDTLGGLLMRSGNLPGAIAALRDAIRLKPDYVSAHYNLGAALGKSGDLTGAIVEFREAIRIKPDYSTAYLTLGQALHLTGDLVGAVEAFRQPTRLYPDDPQAHCYLGHTLRELGRFQEALAAYERGHELGVRRPGWQLPSATWVKECRRLVELESKLSKVLSGQDRPADAAERAELASVAGRKGLCAASARLFAEAFAEQPALADDLSSSRRYNAGCSAALAGCGKGGDDPPPGAAGLARFRAQALGWLKADLTAWAQRINGDETPARAAIVGRLRHWQNDPDLAGVRDPKELAKLPEQERQEWQAFWAEVDAQRQQAEARAARPTRTPAVDRPAAESSRP